MSIQKVGLVGFIAAVLLAFGAFGLQQAQDAEADVATITLANAGVSVAGVVPFTIAAEDDDGVLTITMDNTPGSITAILCNGIACPVGSIGGLGTQVVTINTVGIDANVTLEALSVTGQVNCAGVGPFTLAAAQTQAVAGVPAPAAGVCGELTPGTATTAALTLGPVGTTTLETRPAGAPNTSSVRLAVNVKNEFGANLAGVQVLAIASTGIIESADGIDSPAGTAVLATSTAGTTSTCVQNAVGAAAPHGGVLAEEVNTDGDGNALFRYCANVGSTLGPTSITFIVTRNLAGVPDAILTQSFTIVGPPAALTIAAAPTTLVCGEKATITGTVKDAIGQNVSPGTNVELITNFGGVAIGALGSGASTSSAGISNSADAATSNGAFTGYLLTSTTHVGQYEVVAAVATGTSTIFAQATVTCTAAAAVAPSVTAPNTGTGNISPPNTGDAGLAAASSSNASLFVIFGAVAFVLAGFASFGFARR